jgi:hypothetical protein
MKAKDTGSEDEIDFTQKRLDSKQPNVKQPKGRPAPL